MMKNEALPGRWIYELQKTIDLGIPGWLRGLAPAFGPGPDPGVLGSSPASGSLHGVRFSLCLCLYLSELSFVSHIGITPDLQ